MALTPPSSNPTGGGSPGGSSGELQYNDAGSFGGAAGFTFDDATGAVVISPTAGETELGFGLRLDSDDESNGLLVRPAAGADTNGVTYLRVAVAGGAEALEVGGQDTGENYLLVGAVSDIIGFFGATPAAQQAEPTTMSEVVALLQTYGLSA